MERIESEANGKIKLAARLHQRKYREREGRFVVEGLRFAEMAAASDWVPTLAFVTANAAKKNRAAGVLVCRRTATTPRPSCASSRRPPRS